MTSQESIQAEKEPQGNCDVSCVQFVRRQQLISRHTLLLYHEELINNVK